MNRPLTQREIQKKQESVSDEPKVIVTNCTKRTIIIQLRDKESDFYVGERAIYIGPGKSFAERATLFNLDQLANLKVKGDIKLSGISV